MNAATYDFGFCVIGDTALLGNDIAMKLIADSSRPSGVLIPYKDCPPTITPRQAWNCDYCGAMHPTSIFKCGQCGGPRK